MSKPTLRTFTPGDWGCYAGCESDAPEIADHGWGDVILDGCRVGVTIITETDDPNAEFVQELNATFPNAQAARIIAETIDTPQRAEQLLATRKPCACGGWDHDDGSSKHKTDCNRNGEEN